MELRETLRQNIRRERKLRKWTQTQLAERMRMPQSYVCDVETGKTCPSVDTVEKFAVALGVSPVALFAESSREAVA